MSAMKSGVLLCMLLAMAGLIGGWEDSTEEPAVTLLPTGFEHAGGTKWGYTGEGGRLVIDSLFDEVRYFSEGLAAVKVGNKWGYIDTAARYVVALRFDGAGQFFDGLAPVKADGRWGFIRKDGIFALRPQFDSALEFTRGLAPVRAGRKWGFIDTAGKYLITPRFAGVRGVCFFGGLALVKVKRTWVFVDKTGNVVFRPSQEDAKYPLSGLDLDHLGHKWSYRPDRDSLSNKWGYTDTTGTFIIAPQFDYADMFCYGLALVKAGGEYGFIDKTGRYVWKEKSGKAK